MAIERVRCDLGLESGQALVGASFRYDVLERLARCAERHGVKVLAWGFAQAELRLVLEGDPAEIANIGRGVKVGTTRAAANLGFNLVAGATDRQAISAHELTSVVAWAHQAPLQAGAANALASPWSSHRDLLGFRHAPFFAADALAGRVDPLAVHAIVGGPPIVLPLPAAPAEPEPLLRLLRVAASILGVLPADRRCFKLFVHLARARGWSTRPVADALALTKRRIRQLANTEEPFLGLALTALGHPELSIVP